MRTALLLARDEAARSAIRAMLERDGWNVLEAPSATEALYQSREFGGPIQLLILDVILKEVSARARTTCAGTTAKWPYSY